MTGAWTDQMTGPAPVSSDDQIVFSCKTPLD